MIQSEKKTCPRTHEAKLFQTIYLNLTIIGYHHLGWRSERREAKGNYIIEVYGNYPPAVFKERILQHYNSNGISSRSILGNSQLYT